MGIHRNWWDLFSWKFKEFVPKRCKIHFPHRACNLINLLEGKNLVEEHHLVIAAGLQKGSTTDNQQSSGEEKGVAVSFDSACCGVGVVLWPVVNSDNSTEVLQETQDLIWLVAGVTNNSIAKLHETKTCNINLKQYSPETYHEITHNTNTEMPANAMPLWEILIQKLLRREWRFSVISMNLKAWLKMQHVIRIQKTYHPSISFWQIILIVFKNHGWLRLAYLIFIRWRLLSWKQHLNN